MNGKPHIEYTLEDWVVYWSPNEENKTCECKGNIQCAPCTVSMLEKSWRKTLAAERSSYLALNQRFLATKEKLDALEHNAAERP